MRIHLASVPVDDQQKALRFYTETLGFQLKHNIPLGEHAWITVVSEEAPEGTELVLEPDGHPAVRPFKRALVEDGIPITSFAVDDVKAEHERLVATWPASPWTTNRRHFASTRKRLAAIPLGEHAWITVVSEEAPEGTELVLEPDGHPAVRPFKRALVEDGIPITSFAVDDVKAEHERLVARGVRFVQPPTDLGTVITAVFDDSCGNLIQIAEEKRQP